MILECNCKHEWQDKRYGENMRVHNFAKKASGERGGWRCTVCSSVKTNKNPESDKKPEANKRG
jgi:hypothetical protein